MPTVTRSTSATASSDGARRLAGIAAALVVASLAGGAGADPPKVGRTEPDCPTASEEGQRARDRGKLLEARELFRICSKATCPGVVKKDCTKWLGELEESVPSIVIAARDASSGADLTNVRVVVDGQEVAIRTDGKAIPIDPGEHSLRFEAPNLPPKTETVVIRTGEKNRLFRVELGTAPKAAPPPPATPIGPPAATKPAEPTSKGPPVLGYVLGGVGILAIGGFAVLGATSKSDLDGLKSSCAPYCAESDLDSVKSRMLVADILLGTGAVALVVGAVLILTHGSGSTPQVATASGR